MTTTMRMIMIRNLRMMPKKIIIKILKEKRVRRAEKGVYKPTLNRGGLKRIESQHGKVGREKRTTYFL